ncbi:MAG: ferritin family protein [Candidatus Riflebacteria bacterium]|nr:ferritin family protein [Candidatus Riflebacteria bacterium]
MSSNIPLSEILNTAIAREEGAYFFYLDLIERAESKDAKETLQFIAEEEKKHRRFLVDYKSGKKGKTSLELSTPVNYKIAEHLDEVDPDKPLSSTDIYLIAAHREMAANKFYTELAGMHSDPEVKDMLLKMASEELKHKEKMEYLYSNTAFAQTAGG